MGALAVGLWAAQYVVILLFQALLALTIIVSTLSLAFAGNVLAVLAVRRRRSPSARRSSGCWSA